MKVSTFAELRVAYRYIPVSAFLPKVKRTHELISCPNIPKGSPVDRSAMVCVMPRKLLTASIRHSINQAFVPANGYIQRNLLCPMHA